MKGSRIFRLSAQLSILALLSFSGLMTSFSVVPTLHSSSSSNNESHTGSAASVNIHTGNVALNPQLGCGAEIDTPTPCSPSASDANINLNSGLSERLAAAPGSLSSNNLAPSTSYINETWESVGPSQILNQNGGFTWGTAPFSGRVNVIVYDPYNDDLYVGTAQGGVWESTDNGDSWTPLNDSWPSLAVGAIAVSSTGTVYVGTGDPNTCGTCYYGAGLIAYDNGKSSILGAADFGTNAISNIIVNPKHPSTLLVSDTGRLLGTSCCKGLSSVSYEQGAGGVWISTDSGDSWTLALNASAASGIVSMVMDPLNSSNVYAGGYNGTIWQSTDSGAKWHFLYSDSAITPAGRVFLTMSSSAPDTLFFGIAYTLGGLGAIGKLVVPTTTPTPTFFSLPKNGKTSAGETFNTCGIVGGEDDGPLASTSGQCNYDLLLAVDPTSAKTIYFGGIDLYKSTNGGSSWKDLGGYIPGSLHPDQHALAFSTNGAIYVGNDGGIWTSTDKGSNWSDLNSGLTITQFYTLDGNSTSLVIGGTQDNGCLQSINGTSPPSWNTMLVGDGTFTGFEPTNPNVMYCVTNHLNFWVSTNGGKNWSAATSGINTKESAEFNAPAVQDPNNAGTLYIAGTDVFKTTNYASTWTDVSAGPVFSSSVIITAMAISASDSQILYAGSTTGRVSESTDGGQSWTEVYKDACKCAVTSLSVDPENSSSVYASFAVYAVAHIVRIGTTVVSLPDFQNVSLPQDLAPFSVNVVLAAPQALYVGTDGGGTFWSDDNGTTWAVLGTGMPYSAILDLDLAGGHLFAATDGRGVWELKLFFAAVYGGTVDDYLLQVQQTSDGGYIAVGTTYSFGPGIGNVWVVKTDASGAIEWQKAYGGPGYNYGESIEQTIDGGYIVSGETTSYGNVCPEIDFMDSTYLCANAFVLKLDSEGNVMWQYTYGPPNSDTGALSIIQTTDGGYIFSGYTNQTYHVTNVTYTNYYTGWIVKLTSSGSIEWDDLIDNYTGQILGSMLTVIQTSDGGYAAVGLSTNSSGAAAAIVKLDSSGEVEWEQDFLGVTGSYSKAGGIAQTSDGGYIVSGFTNSGLGGIGTYDAMLLKLDSDGNLVWWQTYGGSSNYFADQVVISGSGYAFVGALSSSSGVFDPWLVKVNSSGGIIWQSVYNADGDDLFEYFTNTTEGGFIVSHDTNSFGSGQYDGILINVNANGEIPGCSLCYTSIATTGTPFLVQITVSIPEEDSNSFQITAGATTYEFTNPPVFVCY